MSADTAMKGKQNAFLSYTNNHFTATILLYKSLCKYACMEKISCELKESTGKCERITVYYAEVNLDVEKRYPQL